MFPRFLLLLSILGPGNGLQFWDTREHRTKEASGPVHLRERRQAEAPDDYPDYDYRPVETDAPEILANVTNTVATHPEPLTTMAVLEQKVSGTSESAGATITGSAGPDAGGLAVGTLSTTQLKPVTVKMTIQPAATEAGTSQPATTEEAGTSQPATTEEAGTSQPATTEEAGTSQPAATEAGTSQPAATEAGTSQPAATEAGTSQPAATEAGTTQLPRIQVVKSQFAESQTTEAPSTETASMSAETTSTEPTDSPIFLGPSVTLKDSAVATGHSNDNSLKNGLFVTPRSSPATVTPGISDLIPVKQCLLAILILASLATIFLVCTVVLAVRLSRKSHMYPVRNYSPTEMICISSLLPEGGEGAPVTANGDLPKVQDLKTEPSENRDEDDLTLRSFLP